MEEPPDSEVPQAPSAYATYIRVALAPLTMYFLDDMLVERRTMDLVDSKICKSMVRRTARQVEVREALGNDGKFWADMTGLFEAAVPSLERRCFNAPDPAATEYEPGYEVASGTLIAKYSDALIADLQRLQQLVLIATNCLTCGEPVQNLCSKSDLDKAIFRLISVCVKVTARGFDGDAGSVDEERWQAVVNIYKTLLVGCLKFLNNLIAHNERRKMYLWCQLFDTNEPSYNATADTSQWQPRSPSKRSFPEDPVLELTQAFANLPGPDRPTISSPFLLFVAKKSIDIKKNSEKEGVQLGMQELTQECMKLWKELPEDEKKYWSSVYDSVISLYHSTAFEPQPSGESLKRTKSLVGQVDGILKQHEDPLTFSDAGTPYKPEDPLTFPEGSEPPDTPKKSQHESSRDNRQTPRALGGYMPHEFADYPEADYFLSDPAPATDGDYRCTFPAERGTEILQKGKDDLMRRLCTYPDPRVPPTAEELAKNPEFAAAVRDAGPEYIEAAKKASSEFAAAVDKLSGETQSLPPEGTSEQQLPPHPDDEASLEAAMDELSEDESASDDSYVVPGDDGRGLLTDVPLILGPTEIEVLPMVILSGIVAPTKPEMPGYKTDPAEMASIRNMHTVRCQLLLSQDNGKNLLRELLIFVAAWDLREEELYFKFMAKIMEAILQDGLMPLAYHEFREYTSVEWGLVKLTDIIRNKDIISPAQAVILKLLTSIFRTRQANLKAAPQGSSGNVLKPPPPLRVEIHTLSFLLTEFRRHIIPQTCALIFLQGQTRLGMANPDDFPLNLWDMERMYEGVYQYLEFFAILTEGEAWKGMMAEWDISSELVTLLIELDGAIPKAGHVGSTANKRAREQMLKTDPYMPSSSSDPSFAPPAPPVQGTLVPSAAWPPAPPGAPTPTTPFQPGAVAVERPYDTITPPAPSPSPYPPSTHSEPADFEWRNLKKLTILVLSSLIWRSPLVQRQVREHGGIEAILSCCNYDEHNPYIREHAIMCLRFLMEGNRENQEVVRSLEAREVVPSEVLDQGGYETFLDGKGRVGLRRKDGKPQGQGQNQGQPQNQGQGQAQGQGQGQNPAPAKAK